MNNELEYLRIKFQLRRNYLQGRVPTDPQKEKIEGMITAFNEVISEIDAQQSFLDREKSHEPRKSN